MSKYILFILLLLIPLKAANALIPQVNSELKDQKMGRIFGKEGIVLNSLGKGASSSVNSDEKPDSSTEQSARSLWNKALEVTSEMPLINANFKDGIILTDWVLSSTKKDSRFKLTIRIININTKSASFKISAFEQVKNKNGEWSEAVSSESIQKHFISLIESKK